MPAADLSSAASARLAVGGAGHSSDMPPSARSVVVFDVNETLSDMAPMAGAYAYAATECGAEVADMRAVPALRNPAPLHRDRPGSARRRTGHLTALVPRGAAVTGTPRAAGLVLGAVADVVVGDPRRGHPVAAFGRAVGAAERVLYADRATVGAVHTALLVGGVAVAGAAAERVCWRHPAWQVLSTAVATWVVLGGTSLAREGAAMARSLGAGDLAAARQRLPSLCGRDPATLDGNGLCRASLESIAENTADAVVAPLLWGAVGGVPGLLAYRAANTLDAMVGYRSPRYRRFGSAAARLDDVANLLPARVAAGLTVLCAPVVGGSARGAVRAWWRDGAAHPSPNAGRVEAAFAGALGVRLGGRTVYPHGVEDRPTLGNGPAPGVGDLHRGVRLSRAVGTAAVVIATAAALGQRAMGLRAVGSVAEAGAGRSWGSSSRGSALGRSPVPSRHAK